MAYLPMIAGQKLMKKNDKITKKSEQVHKKLAGKNAPLLKRFQCGMKPCSGRNNICVSARTRTGHSCAWWNLSLQFFVFFPELTATFAQTHTLETGQLFCRLLNCLKPIRLGLKLCSY